MISRLTKIPLGAGRLQMVSSVITYALVGSVSGCSTDATLAEEELLQTACQCPPHNHGSYDSLLGNCCTDAMHDHTRNRTEEQVVTGCWVVCVGTVLKLRLYLLTPQAGAETILIISGFGHHLRKCEECEIFT